MDSKELDILLKKYWDCETSLEEEARLKAYFRTNDAPERLREAATLFRYFDEQKDKTVGAQFQHTVMGEIKTARRADGGRMVRLFQNSLRIAAGIAVVLLAVYFVRQEIRKEDPVAMEDTYDDPQRAFEETKKALLMISKGFGSAEQQARKINIFNEAQEKVQSSAQKDETEL